MSWTPNTPQRLVLFTGSILLAAQWYRSIDYRDDAGISVALVLVLALGMLCAALYKTQFKHDTLVIKTELVSRIWRVAMYFCVIASVLMFATHVLREIKDIKFNVSWIERQYSLQRWGGPKTLDKDKEGGLPAGLDPNDFGPAIPQPPRQR